MTNRTLTFIPLQGVHDLARVLRPARRTQDSAPELMDAGYILRVQFLEIIAIFGG